MFFFERLSQKIGNDLVSSGIVKEEDVEIYIFGIYQIMVSLLNIFSSLFIGLIFGAVFEIIVFMAAYIPLRSFAGGYHAKTPLRCYIFSVIMLIAVSVGFKYLYISGWVCYVVLLVAALFVLLLSPVEDKNKPLDEIEHKVYKKKATFIAVAEVLIAFAFKFIGLYEVFIGVVYSFAVLSVMLVAGKVKNHFGSPK